MFLEVCNRLEFHPDCVNTLLDAYKAVQEKAPEALSAACSSLMAGDEEACEAQVAQIVSATDVCRQTVIAVILIESVPLLKKVYEKKNISDDILWDTLVDVRCKLNENHDTGAPWGTGALGWYIRLYSARIIKLGRLEFEPIAYKWDTPYRSIRKGDPVMNMHIPSTGPMKIEDVLDSFKRAYQFYGYTQPMPVAAASWLLYPPICEQVMKPGSNLKNFYDLFDVVETYEDPDNHNFWRIYNMHWEEGVLDRVPLDTSLRMNLYHYMKPGRNMGVGRCMLLFDGEKVISK